jgi:hypothetical protein
VCGLLVGKSLRVLVQWLSLMMLQAWATIQKLAQRAGGKSVCEVSRYLIPAPWLHDSFDAVAGWISTTDDVQLNTECKSSPPVDAFCTFLATG